MIDITYVNFKQAKLLREKGFDVPVCSYYSGDKLHQNYSIINQNSQEYLEDKGDCLIIPYSSEERSLYLNTIDFNAWGDDNYSAPEQWLVIEWLRIKHNIWIQTPYNYYYNELSFCWIIININGVKRDDTWLSGIDTKKVGFNTPQEAMSDAIDYVLEKLI